MSCGDTGPAAAEVAAVEAAAGEVTTNAAAPVQRLDGATMGTYFRVTAICDTAGLSAQIEQTLASINAQMSNYDADSELSKLNRSEHGHWQPVSSQLMQVLQAAHAVHEASAGVFDVSVAPILRLWGFGPDAATTLPPAASELAAAQRRSGWQYLELAPDRLQIKRLRGLEFDLSALAKGYAVDVVSEVLQQAGCPRHLVDIGGEVRASGLSTQARPWRIGVEVPQIGASGEVQRVLHVVDRSIATSGDYRNFIRQEAEQWGHTIDPRSARPVKHDLASVTVVHGDTMLADAWATALNVMGPE